MRGGGIFTSCQDEPINNTEQSISELKKGNIKNDILLEISYDIETSSDYKFDEKSCSKIDMAGLNPRSEKERIFMRLYTDGSSDIIIEKLEEKEEIKVSHKIAESDLPQTAKTVIQGGEMTVYDKNGKKINAIKFSQPNSTLLVENLKELIADNNEKDIENFVYNMQGAAYTKNIEKLMEQARTNSNIKIEEFGDTHVTLRMKMSEFDQKSSNEMVLLIDRINNRMVGNRIYNEKGELKQTSYMGYNTGKQKYLNAIRTESYEKLSSGNEYVEVTNSYINNFDFKLFY